MQRIVPITVLLALTACGAERRAVMRNEITVRRVFEEAANQRRLEVLPELFAADYLGPQGVRGPAAFGAVLEALLTGFPDLRYVIEETVAAGDRVAVRWRWSGTHRGRYRELEPTGKQVTNTGMAIFELRDGRIVRSAVETDRLGFLEQVKP